MMFRSIFITLIFFVFSLSIIELVLSFYQITSSTSDISQDLDERTKDLCTLSTYSPQRVVFSSVDTEVDVNIYLQCGWNARNSAQRIIVYFATIASIIGIIITILQKKSFEYVIVSSIILLCGISGFYSSIYDAQKIYYTKNACELFVSSNPFKNQVEAECDFKYFYLIVSLGFIAASLILFTSIYSLRIRSRIFNNANNSGPQFFENKNISNKTDPYPKFSQQKQQQQQHINNNNNNNDNYYREDKLSNENNNTGAILTTDSYPNFALKSI